MTVFLTLCMFVFLEHEAGVAAQTLYKYFLFPENTDSVVFVTTAASGKKHTHSLTSIYMRTFR